MKLDESFIARLEEVLSELTEKTENLPDEDLDRLEHQVDVLFKEFQIDMKNNRYKL